MNRYHCDKEQEIVEAVRTRVWTADLRSHAHSCQLCADVVVVAGLLQHEAELTNTERTLPSAALIWWKAQLLSKNIALERATRPIELLGKFAYLTCGLAVLWFMFGSSQGSLWVADILKYQIARHLWTGYMSELMLIGGGGTLLSVLLGSLYMVWAEK